MNGYDTAFSTNPSADQLQSGGLIVIGQAMLWRIYVPKQQVIEQLQAARAALLTAIEGLSDDVMLRPGVVGMWSIKDVLAHLSAWESELVTALSQLDNSASIPGIVRIDDIDEWNDEQ